nr:hypothetical protein [Tanacetum cinerariifolium]
MKSHPFYQLKYLSTLIDSSQKIDYLEEFYGELAHINPEIKESDFDFEEEIRLIENLLYDHSFPRPPEELNAEIANTVVESIPSSHIPVQDGDSQREEIDIVLKTDDVLPPSVENNDDSEGEIDAIEELHVDNSSPMLKINAEFNFKQDAEEEISVVMNASRDEFDVSNDENDDYCSFIFVIRIFMPYLICYKVFSFPLSAESEDTILDPDISV